MELRKEIGKVIVGQQEAVDLLLTAILADGHVLIEGVPGVAKTLLARLLAKLVDARFSRIQFTPERRTRYDGVQHEDLRVRFP